MLKIGYKNLQEEPEKLSRAQTSKQYGFHFLDGKEGKISQDERACNWGSENILF